MSALLVTLHVVAAVFIIGPMAVLPMLALPSVRTRHAATLKRFATSTNLFSILSLVVFVLGFGALAVSDPKDQFSVVTPWILGSIILYLGAVSLNLFVTVPVMRGEAVRIQSDSSASSEQRSRSYGTIAGSSGFSALALVAVVVLMVWKP